MQAAGRAGRDAAYMAAKSPGHTVRNVGANLSPQHAVFYEALRRHDYEAFAAQQLKEREEAAMPPFAYQALVRADARTQEAAQGFLQAATAAAHAAELPGAGGRDAVPPCRSPSSACQCGTRQMLMESPSRAALQRFLAAWQPILQTTPKPRTQGLDTLAGGCGPADDLRVDAGASWQGPALRKIPSKAPLRPPNKRKQL